MTMKATEAFDLGSAPVQEVVDRGGAWMHLRHPYLDHLLYTGKATDTNTGSLIGDENDAKPIRVKILSVESSQYKEALGEARRKLSFSNPRPTPEQYAEQQEKMLHLLTAAVIVEFDNVVCHGKTLDANNKDDVEMFLSIAPSYKRQVQNFSDTIRNFFGQGSAGWKPPEPGSAG